MATILANLEPGKVYSVEAPNVSSYLFVSGSAGTVPIPEGDFMEIKDESGNAVFKYSQTDYPNTNAAVNIQDDVDGGYSIVKVTITEGNIDSATNNSTRSVLSSREGTNAQEEATRASESTPSRSVHASRYTSVKTSSSGVKTYNLCHHDCNATITTRTNGRHKFPRNSRISYYGNPHQVTNYAGGILTINRNAQYVINNGSGTVVVTGNVASVSNEGWGNITINGTAENISHTGSGVVVVNKDVTGDIFIHGMGNVTVRGTHRGRRIIGQGILRPLTQDNYNPCRIL